MARILFGWDNGLGTGYVDRLLQVADALAAEGHEPVFCIRDLIATAGRLAAVRYPVLQSPVAVGQLDPFVPRFVPGSFGDLLAVSNFNNEAELMRLMLAWDLLFQTVQPELIVAEYAPVMSLAAYGRYKLLAMGHGYILPPPDLPQFPIFDYTQSPFATQEAIFEVCRRVQAARGLPQLAALPAFLGGSAHVVTAYPEIDPYDRLRRDKAVGPLERYAPLPPPAEPRFYAYLAADFRQLRLVLEGLVNSRLPGSVYIKRITPPLRQFLSERGVAVLNAPPPLAQAVAEASVIVHHGGIATTMAAMGLGRPQLLWPQVADQTVTAQGVEVLRVGEIATRSVKNAAEAAAALRRLAEDRETMSRAQALAARLAQRHGGGGLAVVMEKARALLAG
ncbi:MAG: glycosyltransferase [Reyranellaceae bacterium]